MPKGANGIQSLVLEMPLKSYCSVLMLGIDGINSISIYCAEIIQGCNKQSALHRWSIHWSYIRCNARWLLRRTALHFATYWAFATSLWIIVRTTFIRAFHSHSFWPVWIKTHTHVICCHSLLIRISFNCEKAMSQITKCRMLTINHIARPEGKLCFIFIRPCFKNISSHKSKSKVKWTTHPTLPAPPQPRAQHPLRSSSGTAAA